MGVVMDGTVPQRRRFFAASALRRRAGIVAVAMLSVAALCFVTAAGRFRLQRAGERRTGLRHRPGPVAPKCRCSGPKGETVATQNADADGGLLFRNVTPAKALPGQADLQQRRTGSDHGPRPERRSPGTAAIYKQSIPNSGYGYLTTRDGTQLAIDVHPPGLPSGLAGSAAFGAFEPQKKKGAVPTLIEYAGYGYANPNGPESGLAQLANIMGFAVVDVNMRGTGCSGGAFDYFEPLQNLDAYDVIEMVAHQSWVLHHKVGMFGISYGGISQLFAAQQRPAGA